MYRIVIVDDETDLIKPLKKMLKSMGYAVVGSTSTGEEAVVMAKDLLPDLILMDIKMPGKMDGITAYADESLIDRAKRVMPYGYLLKPFRQEELKIAIEIALYIAQVETKRKQAEEALQKAHDELEQKAAERTAELVVANQQLHNEILERKRSEEELRKNEETIRALVNATADSVGVIDADGTILTINVGGAKRLGRSPDEIIGRCIYDFLPADVAEGRKKQVAKVFSSGKYIRFLDQRADMLLENSIYPIFDMQRKVERIAVFARDITEQKQIEEKSQRQAAVLEAINKVFREALICESDEDVARTCLSVAEELTNSKFGFIGEVNQAGLFDTIAISNPGWDTCKMLDSKATRLIKNMKIRGIDRSVLKEEKSRIVNDPSSHPDRVGAPKNHPPITSFLGVPLKHSARTIGMVGLANKESDYDLADQEAIEALSISFIEALNRKRAEEALEKSERKYRNLFEQSRDAIYITSRDGKFVDLNHSALDLFGYRKEDMLRLNASEVYDNVDDRRSFQKEIEQKGSVKDYQVNLKNKDGKKIDCLLSSSVIYADDGSILGYQGIIRDITLLKRTEQAL